MKILKSSLMLIDEALKILTVLESDEIRFALLNTDHGNRYIKSIIEIMAVCERVNFSAKKFGKI